MNSKFENTVIITGSGTLGMEASISCIATKEDIILCISNGKFGERFKEIADKYTNVIHLKYNWGESINIHDIEKILDINKKINIITAVHNETSTGILNPIKEIGNIAKKKNIYFVVDVITSFGGETLDFQEYNIDIAIAATQKCISAPPGLSIISISDKAIDKIKTNLNRPYYLDLLKYRYDSIPYTPSIPLFYGLQESLKMIKNIGINKQIERHKIYSKSIKIGLENMNLKQFSSLNKWSSYSNTHTVIKCPNIIDSLSIKKELSRRGIIVAQGHDHIKNSVFRIGNMGFITFSDIIITLTQIENILLKYKIIDKFGYGIQATLEFIDPYYDKI